MANTAPSSLHANDADELEEDKEELEEDDAKAEEPVFDPANTETWPIAEKVQEFLAKRAAEDDSDVILAEGVPWETFLDHRIGLKLLFEDGKVSIISVPDEVHGTVRTEIAGHFRSYSQFFPHLSARNFSNIPIHRRVIGRDADVIMDVTHDDKNLPDRRGTCVVDLSTSSVMNQRMVRKLLRDYLVRGDVGCLIVINAYYHHNPATNKAEPTGGMVAVMYDRPAVLPQDLGDPHLNLMDAIQPVWARSFGTAAPPLFESRAQNVLNLFPGITGVGIPPIQNPPIVCNGLGQHILEIPAARIYHNRQLPPGPRNNMTASHQLLLAPVLALLPPGTTPPLRIDLFRLQCAFRLVEIPDSDHAF